MRVVSLVVLMPWLALGCTQAQAPPEPGPGALEVEDDVRGGCPEPAPAPEPEPEPEPEQRARPIIEGPRLRILGIAQDGGLPHIGCSCERCEAGRHDPSRASPVASVAAIGPQGGSVWIVDATPDLPAQLDLLADVRDAPRGQVDRAPLSGIMLTHAHIGHYLGLAHLGFEAASAEGIPVHASAQMVEFLGANAPWDQLVKLHNIAPVIAEAGVSIDLGDGLSAEPLVVPHRGEYTDTLGWYLAGPRKRALYIPDTDPWAKWEADIGAALDGVDLLLIDGTFYSGDELPGRDVSKIGHPLMTDTMDRFEDRLGDAFELWFIHLNHSNPTLDPSSPQRQELERRGFAVAELGREFGL